MACVATYVKHMRRPLPEKMLATFPPGTFQRIEAVSADDEDRTAFVRSAVRHELERREFRRLLEKNRQLAKTSARNS